MKFIKQGNMGLFSKTPPTVEEEINRLKNILSKYVFGTGYKPQEHGDLIFFTAESDVLGVKDEIYLDPNTRFNNGKIIKNIITFSGRGIPFNSQSPEEIIRAVALLKGNTTMRANGYWGIEHTSGRDWVNYFVDVYEDGLNNETFMASVLTILSAKKNFQKVIMINM